MKNIFLLIMIAVVGVFTLDVYLPGMQSMANQFNVSISDIVSTFTVFTIVFSFAQLFHGTASDFIGRKPILIAGLSLAALATVVCIYATDYQTLFIARMIQALGISSFVVVNAIIRDLFEGTKAIKVRTFVMMASGISISVAPTIGGLLHERLSWQGGFIASLVLILFTLIVAIFLYQESLVNKTQKNINSIISSYYSLLKNKIYLSYAFAAMLAYTVHFTFIMFSANIFLNQFGLSPLHFGYLMIAYGGVCFISGFGIAKIADKFSAMFMIKTGSGLIGLGSILMIFLSMAMDSPWQVLIPMAIITMGITMIRPSAVTSALADIPEQAGQGAAGINLIQFSLSGIIATLLTKIGTNQQLVLSLLGMTSTITIIYLLKRLENENFNNNACSI